MKRILLGALLGLGSLQMTYGMHLPVYSDNVQCPICFEDFNRAEPVICLTCCEQAHPHHAQCIAQWAATQKKASCSQCRGVETNNAVFLPNGTLQGFKGAVYRTWFPLSEPVKYNTREWNVLTNERKRQYIANGAPAPTAPTTPTPSGPRRSVPAVPGSPTFVKPACIPQALWDELDQEEKAWNMQFVPKSAVDTTPAPRRVTFAPDVRPEGISQALWNSLSPEQRLFIAQSVTEQASARKEQDHSLFTTAGDYCRRIVNKDDKKKSSSEKGSTDYIPASELAAGLLMGFLAGRELKKREWSHSLLYPVVSVPASYAALNKINPERNSPVSKWLLGGLVAGGTIGYFLK